MKQLRKVADALGIMSPPLFAGIQLLAFQLILAWIFFDALVNATAHDALAGVEKRIEFLGVMTLACFILGMCKVLLEWGDAPDDELKGLCCLCGGTFLVQGAIYKGLEYLLFIAMSGGGFSNTGLLVFGTMVAILGAGAEVLAQGLRFIRNS